MKRLTFILAALCVIACAATSQAKNRAEEFSFAVATTNSTDVLVDTGAYTGEFATFDTVYLSVPEHQTGTVSVAVMRGTVYQTLLTTNLVNTGESATVTSVDMSDTPVNGRLKFTFKQTRASTNVWSGISFFNSLN